VAILKYNFMTVNNPFDVIIVGGSYSGLAAGMAMGRALKKVLIIDDGKPCNRQTPHSHNFITHDGVAPAAIAESARARVKKYDTVQFFNGLATSGVRTEYGFEISTASGEIFSTKKIIFATGIRDILPDIEGLAACWGISVLHCPYCHGYEVRQEKTGILSNGAFAFDFARLISNWTNDITLFTNGPSMLTVEQKEQLEKHHISVVEKDIESLEHSDGYIQHIIFRDGTKFLMKALYAPVPFEQHCTIPSLLGCQLTEEGYVKIDSFMETTVAGVFACGDNASTMRTVANAVAMGTTAGMVLSKKMILEEF
jgi:thioredoxin reductase